MLSYESMQTSAFKKKLNANLTFFHYENDLSNQLIFSKVYSETGTSMFAIVSIVLTSQEILMLDGVTVFVETSTELEKEDFIIRQVSNCKNARRMRRNELKFCGT